MNCIVESKVYSIVEDRKKTEVVIHDAYEKITRK